VSVLNLPCVILACLDNNSLFISYVPGPGTLDILTPNKVGSWFLSFFPLPSSFSLGLGLSFFSLIGKSVIFCVSYEPGPGGIIPFAFLSLASFVSFFSSLGLDFPSFLLSLSILFHTELSTGF